MAGREWLVFDPENVVMFCKDCRMYTKEKNKTNNFVKAVKDHESARSYQESFRMKSAKTGRIEVSLADVRRHMCLPS